MLAAPAEGFEEPLPGRRGGQVHLAHVVAHDHWDRGRLFRCLVLDNFERPDTSALVSPPTQEKTAIGRRCKAHRTSCREVRPWIEIGGDPDGVPQDGPVDVIGGIDVDAPPGTHHLTGLRGGMRLRTADRLAYEMQGHLNFRVSDMRES